MKAQLKERSFITDFKSAGLHPKNLLQKERLLSSEHWLCMERAKFYTDSYRETEGEHPSIHAVKMLKRTSNKMTIKI